MEDKDSNKLVPVEPFGYYEDDFGFNFPNFFGNQAELLAAGKLTALFTHQPDAAAEIARLKELRSIEVMQLETQRCTIAQQVEQLSLANLALENRGQIIEQHAERIKELEAEVAADWERRAECGRQLAAANALIEQAHKSLQGLCDRLGPRWFLEQNWADPLTSLAAIERHQKGENLNG